MTYNIHVYAGSSWPEFILLKKTIKSVIYYRVVCTVFIRPLLEERYSSTAVETHEKNNTIYVAAYDNKHAVDLRTVISKTEFRNHNCFYLKLLLNLEELLIHKLLKQTMF